MPSIGKQSIILNNSPHILCASSVVGKKEGEGPLKDYFDEIYSDNMLGMDNWEEAESALMEKAINKVIEKSGLMTDGIRYLFTGDLLGQLIASSFGVINLKIPWFGLYGACSTCGEGLALAAMTVDAGYANNVVAATSSHYCSAEKQFRFPLNYGNQKPASTTFTVTGSGAFIVGRDGGIAKITGLTPGRIIDYGIKDSQNMGACMAPAAMDTIYNNLKDFNVQPDEYDRIITGDLGDVGSEILIKLLRDKDMDIGGNHMDCGQTIFNSEEQKTYSGGSGCGCAAVTFASYVLDKIEKKEWKKVLFVPTGALMSTVSFNEGQNVPGIAHGLVIESI